MHAMAGAQERETMEIKDWSSTGARSALYRELKQLDLLENMAELDGFGYTIIPPE